MQKIKFIYLFFFFVLVTACSDFLSNAQEQVVSSEELFQNKDDFRSVQRGLYILQQDLIEQLIVLGELRADLMTVTENATEDQLDVHNFQMRSDNAYADATGFYRLIVACNDLISTLENLHPEVLDKDKTATWYDYLYGEVLCMRAWAYFNNVRIYGKVPYIVDQYSKVDELIAYVSSSVHVSLPDSTVESFNMYGEYVQREVVESLDLDSAWVDINDVIEIFTAELEDRVKIDVNGFPAIGIANLDDNRWVGMWNSYAYYSLLGQLYLYDNNLDKAKDNFAQVLAEYDLYNLDDEFSFEKWKNIFTQINSSEDIFAVYFNKNTKQTNDLQSMFDFRFPNKYQLKPTEKSIFLWETIWDDFRIRHTDNQPDNPVSAYIDIYDEDDIIINTQGVPGDYYRGIGVSFKYIKDGEEIDIEEVEYALNLRRKGDLIGADEVFRSSFPMISKYCLQPSGSLNDEYDADAKVSIFRAAQIHFYYAEVLNWQSKGRGYTAANVVNYGGAAIQPSTSLGIRGRVGFADADPTGTLNHERIDVAQSSFYYVHNPYSNMIDTFYYYDKIGTKDYGFERAKYLEDEFMKEAAREMAYEGERFYDLVRIAKRRGDNAYLANAIASKFPASEQETIKQKLMDQSNWYVPFYINAQD